MPAMLLSLLSGAVVAATPRIPQPWFDFAEDYPMKAFERKWEGVTQFQLLVAPDGSVADCSVLKSSGHEILDTQACFLAQKRITFRPAKGSGGQSVWGLYRTEAKWALPEHQLSGTAAPDLEVTVNKLPNGAKMPPAVKLAYAVDVQGQVSQCTMMPSSLQQPQVLVELGCKQLLSRENGKPVLGPSGQPVPAVRTGAVLFTAGS
jgi:TonB family protein